MVKPIEIDAALAVLFTDRIIRSELEARGLRELAPRRARPPLAWAQADAAQPEISAPDLFLALQ